MYKIYYTNRMKKDIRRAQKSGRDISKLTEVLNLLQTGEPLPEKYDDHNLKDFRECHIESDWLLLYKIFEDELILSATATGSHSYIFGK